MLSEKVFQFDSKARRNIKNKLYLTLYILQLQLINLSSTFHCIHPKSKRKLVCMYINNNINTSRTYGRTLRANALNKFNNKFYKKKKLFTKLPVRSKRACPFFILHAIYLHLHVMYLCSDWVVQINSYDFRSLFLRSIVNHK